MLLQYSNYKYVVFAGGPGSSKAEKIDKIMNNLNDSFQHINVGKLLTEQLSDINTKDRFPPKMEKQISKNISQIGKMAN